MKPSLISAVLAGLALAVIASIPGSAQEKVRLVASGGSFPYPIYAAWFEQFSRKSGGTTVDYRPKGSGDAVQDLIGKTVDFAASDAAMTDEQIAKVAGGVQMLPMTAGEVVLAYNVPGVKDLKLSRDVYPAIFMGKIAKWNDPRIAAANPGTNLPDLDIIVVRRADRSGTTFVFTNHLSAISPEWKQAIGAGTSVKWPTSDRIIPAPRNDGIGAAIRQIPGAIGYVEYAYAKRANIGPALLQNKAGQYVVAGAEGGPEALLNAKLPPDLRLWLPDPDGAKSYPITTYTWMVFYKKYRDPAKAAALRQMVEYCLTDGQKISAQMGYIPLPANVVAEVRKAAENIQ